MNYITTEAEALAAIAGSAASPIFIYKHSPICGLSDTAILEFQRFVKEEAAGFKYFQVDVIADRPASMEIEKLLGVRHESPQALLVWKSACTWHASHRNIKSDKLKAEAERFRNNLTD